jgi:hypothetical protein
VPDQAPEAEHEVALFADQTSVDAVPDATVLGAALSVTAGGNDATVTVADCVAEPLALVQVSSYSVVLETAPVDQVPLVATGPCQPPAAVQAVALAAFQLRVDVPPLVIVVGDVDSVTVGASVVTTTFVATGVTAGFAAPLAAGSGRADWPADDCPQAANAENAAHPTIPRNKREAAAERSASRMLVVILVSRPDFKENSDPKRGLRPTNFIRCFPHPNLGIA